MLGFQFLATVTAKLHGAKDADFMPKTAGSDPRVRGVSGETAAEYFRIIAEAKAKARAT